MIYLLEEFSIDNPVYMLVETTRDLLLGKYTVEDMIYEGINKRRVHLKLVSNKKKNRYFKPSLQLVGYDTENAMPPGIIKYNFFEEEKDAIEHFCKNLNAHSKNNPKLFKRLSHLYPQWCKFNQHSD